MTPLISVITPTYNHENYIGQCIDSVLNQTFADWEMIIIDDGSTDGTSTVVASYDDRRIRYLRQKNVGIWRLSETYNKGLKLARGKYIAILEGDDFWPSYKLEKQVQALENKNVVLAFGKSVTINEVGEYLYVFPRDDLTKDIYQNRPKGKILEKLLLENVIPPQTAVCRKNSLIQIGGFKQPPGVPAVDVPTWLELSLVGRFSATNEILGYYRRHRTQITRVTNPVKRGKAINEFSERFYSQLSSKIKSKLNIRMKTLRTEHQRKLGEAHFNAGRINLLNHNWRESRQYFVRAVKKCPFSTKLKALLGLGLSFTRRDFESIAKALGRPRLR